MQKRSYSNQMDRMKVACNANVLRQAKFEDDFFVDVPEKLSWLPIEDGWLKFEYNLL